jgi:hypothetical protein
MVPVGSKRLPPVRSRVVIGRRDGELSDTSAATGKPALAFRRSPARNMSLYIITEDGAMSIKHWRT